MFKHSVISDVLCSETTILFHPKIPYEYALLSEASYSDALHSLDSALIPKK
jgi:hypothetical protein